MPKPWTPEEEFWLTLNFRYLPLNSAASRAFEAELAEVSGNARSYFAAKTHAKRLEISGTAYYATCYTLEETAELLGITRRTLSSYLNKPKNRKDHPTIRSGYRTLVPPKTLEKLQAFYCLSPEREAASVTVAEAADMLCITHNYVYRLVEFGILKSFKHRKQFRVYREGIDAALRAQRREGVQWLQALAPNLSETYHDLRGRQREADRARRRRPQERELA